MVAVLLSVFEECGKEGTAVRLVEGTVAAVAGEVRMTVVDQGSVLSRIIVEPTVGHVLGTVGTGSWRNGLIGTGEVALAVPSVTRAVLVPERVIDGTDDTPETAVVLARMD